MKAARYWSIIVIIFLPAAAWAQLSLPGVGPGSALPERTIGEATSIVLDPVTGAVEGHLLDRLSRSELNALLNRMRIDRVNRFLRENRAYVERDHNGDPAVRGILVATGISEPSISKAVASGFTVVERGWIDGLDISFVKFSTRNGASLKSERKKLKKIAREAEISGDNIYFTSATAATGAAASLPAAALSGGSAKAATIGLIDGGVARHDLIKIPVEQRGFAKGGPVSSAHGTAIASLISMSREHRRTGLLAADIYGSDPAGGNATAIARALGWMATRKIPVVTISLVGPDNGLLRRAIRSAQGKGMLIVAAVGNDGPAAPPRFPASYKGVLGVTGVDRRHRALPEAGIATPVDFAAPGADIKGASPGGKTVPLRGTSFAAPLVAARLAAHYPSPDIAAIEKAVTGLIHEARDLGKKGTDKVFGHGLVCESCAAR
ncbi:S8 family serine peptidase [Sphingorhabdus sp. SMR4y]|uniref:S8 family serine peptidase n=1 Tax=Sphingorhabdus sp. SMR4y TaxID=2584094 RepID=UPI000B5CABE6|nr:S8 family serine peptidase [Sphingorhabdus sp. SMR4y]ASK87933.1 minor extracellular protease Epr [Sphingorhabdus sp. SMR4y]